VICFGESDKSCMSVMYRGHGPEAGRFDFTPTFYSANCPRADIPSALEKECRALDSAARSKGYADALNCFETPTDAKCTAVMAQAKVVKDADIPKRDRCLKVGEDHYNDEQTDPKERRSDDCNYSEQSLGGQHGKHWKLLLPAACRDGTYVDQFGLDCCSADIRFAAHTDPECRAFYPKR